MSKKKVPRPYEEEWAELAGEPSCEDESGELEEEEAEGKLSFFPIKVGDVPCVLMLFDEPVEHLIFDGEELEQVFTAAMETLEAAEDDDINKA
jgi:hypothetical protein